jgi:hypothetical protein
MGISVKGEGEDKIAKDLMEMISGMEDEVKDWIERIGKTAKEICKDPDCKRIKLRLSDDGQGISYDIPEGDPEAVNCIIKAVEKHYNSLPLPLQDIFRKIVDDLKNNRKNIEGF